MFEILITTASVSYIDSKIRDFPNLLNRFKNFQRMNSREGSKIGKQFVLARTMKIKRETNHCRPMLL